MPSCSSFLAHAISVLFALFLATGCTAQIGDKCSLSTDCSVQGDRLCDTTQPDGYCTIFNCEPYRCPGESVCVEFHTEIDPDPKCFDPRRWPRFERTFCMRRCEADSDCRSGYSCVNQDLLLKIYDAALVDEDTSICIASANLLSKPPDEMSYDVCQTDGGTPLPDGDIPYYDGGVDGGAAGSGGEGGQGGSGGDGVGGAGGDAGSGGSSGGAGGSAGNAGASGGGMSGGGGTSGAAGTSGSGGQSGAAGMSGSGGASGGGAGGASGAGGAGGASGSGGASGASGAGGAGGA